MWQPTPVLFPGKFHGQKSLARGSPWGHKESDMTERLGMQKLTHTHTRIESFKLMYHRLNFSSPVHLYFLLKLSLSINGMTDFLSLILYLNVGVIFILRFCVFNWLFSVKYIFTFN